MVDIATLDEVRYQYPDSMESVLDGVSWHLEEGTFALLLGKSGSGKSTLLRCLNGLVPHFTGGRFGGVVQIGSRDTRRNGPRDLAADVGFVFQDPEAQMLTDRVDDEIAFGLEQQGTDLVVMRKRVEEMLDLLGLVTLRGRSPSTLSGGERQRVAIAAALAAHPRLLVLDEPTSQLDPWAAEEVLTALKRFNEDLGISVVLAEHRLERVLVHADQIRLLDRQQVAFNGSPAGIAQVLDADALPPVTSLGRHLGWESLPLTVKEARRHPQARMVSDRLASVAQPARPSSPGAPVISVEGAGVNLGGAAILRDVSLKVHEGEFLALMGRNGSGKTTLLRMILGLQDLSHGAVRVEDTERPQVHPDALGGLVGYVPQQPGTIFFHERVIDELCYSARLRGVNESDLHGILDLVGLGFAAERHPRDLSGGERQRAAVAAVLAGQPRVLMLDEPTRGMDPWHRRQMIEVLHQVQADGVAVVMATHDVELVAGAADRVVMLGNGSVVVDGSPVEVLADSLTFTTQINKIFGGPWLTVNDVVAAMT